MRNLHNLQNHELQVVQFVHVLSRRGGAAFPPRHAIGTLQHGFFASSVPACTSSGLGESNFVRRLSAELAATDALDVPRAN